MFEAPVFTFNRADRDIRVGIPNPCDIVVGSRMR